MVAFEVSVNGVHVALVGVETLGVLSAIIHAGRAGPDDENEDVTKYVSLTLGGLTGSQPREFVNWVSDRELNTGDEVLVRIVDVARVDEPRRREPAGSNANKGASSE